MLLLSILACAICVAHAPGVRPEAVALSEELTHVVEHFDPDGSWSVGTATTASLRLVPEGAGYSLLASKELLQGAPAVLLDNLELSEKSATFSAQELRAAMAGWHDVAHKRDARLHRERLVAAGGGEDFDPMEEYYVGHLNTHAFNSDGDSYFSDEPQVVAKSRSRFMVHDEGAQVRIVAGPSAMGSHTEADYLSAAGAEAFGGWRSFPIGGARRGTLLSESATSGTIAAYGADVWYGYDSFQFVHQAVSGDFEIMVKLDNLKAPEEWSKGGLMVRQSLAPDATMVFLCTFASGQVEIAQRDEASAEVTGDEGPLLGAQLGYLRMRRADGKFSVATSSDGGEWDERLVETPLVQTTDVFVGLGLVSQSGDEPAILRFRDLTLDGESPMPPRLELTFSQADWPNFLEELHGAQH